MNAMLPNRLTGPELERLLFHWPRVVEVASLGWSRDFALSIAAHSRRRGWKPSPKQEAMMRRMVSDLFTHGATNGLDDPLLEEVDRHAPDGAARPAALSGDGRAGDAAPFRGADPARPGHIRRQGACRSSF